MELVETRHIGVRDVDPIPRNIFSIQHTDELGVPVPGENAEVEAEYKSHWLKQIRLVCIPLFILGFPVHLLFRDENVSDPPKRKSLSRAYLCPPFFAIQSAILLILPLCILTFVAYHAWHIFFYLIIVADLQWNLFVHLTYLIRAFPAVLPLFVCWLRGPSIKKFISSFDTLRWDFYMALKNVKLRNHPILRPKSDGNPYLRKLIILYGIIFITHIIPIFVDKWIQRSAISFWIGSLYSFTLPVYCTLCWAIFEEYKTLSRYLKSLMVGDGTGPTVENLARIKIWYRKIGRHVIFVNYTFGFYLCWVIPNMVFSIFLHLGFLLVYFAGYATVKLYFVLIDLAMDDEATGEEPHAALFRRGLAHVFVALLQLLLTAYTVKQAVDINDEARFTHILLNEYLNDHSTWIIKNDDLYKASRHLKSYMYVTHEQDNPAFIRIPIVQYTPLLSRRLHKQSLRDTFAHGRFLQEVV